MARYRAEGEVAFEPRSRRPKTSPGTVANDTHDRVRHDRVDRAGSVTLRRNGRLHHVGVGRTHAGTCVILLVQDLDIRIVNAATGELLRELILNPHIDYKAPEPQRTHPETTNSRTQMQVRLLPMS